MTRSEEELGVGTRQREAGRARLRKWVDTEHVSTSVPVAREEVRIEREPIADANVDRALQGQEISEAEYEVTLMEEEAVAGTETVPKGAHPPREGHRRRAGAGGRRPAQGAHRGRGRHRPRAALAAWTKTLRRGGSPPSRRACGAPT